MLIIDDYLCFYAIRVMLVLPAAATEVHVVHIVHGKTVDYGRASDVSGDLYNRTTFVRLEEN